ncbi:MAG: hypothetical protein J6S00_02885, partial [Clostridia bacterium]|nr:hypothetical protein [Clostridia bacterium]
MKRLSKKLLSVVLAMALIVSCVTVCFTAFAETDNTNVYQVEFTSPAIPMVKGTQISLADIEVQLTSGGEYVSGSSLTVSDIDAGLVYNAEAGTVTVYAKGVYPITVSDGTATKTVYVVAADTADGPFNIFEYDFADFEADIAEGKGNWHLSGFKKPQTNPEKIKDVTSSIATRMQWDSSKNALVFGNYDLALWTTNDVLESFKDYTIKTTAGSATTAYNEWRNYGVMARVIPGADEIAPFDTGSKYIMIGMGPGTAQGSICRFYVGRPVYAGSWAAAKTEFYWSANTAYDYAYKFEGSTVTVS